MVTQAKIFTPSIYQQAVFDWQTNPRPESLSLALEAVAGSGKTKTLTELIRHIPDRFSVVYLAFNSSVVKEMKPKVESLGKRSVPVECKTMNSMGMGTWVKSGYASSGFEISPELNYELMRKYMVRHGPNVFLSEELKGSLMTQASGMDPKSKARFETMLEGGKFDKDQSFISRLVGLAKGHGLVPSNFASQLTGGLMEDSRSNWIGLIEEYDLEFISRDVAIEVARRILCDSIGISKSKSDFDSQLWLPVIFGCEFKQYDQILVDEAQDLNPINIEIARRILKPGGRSVFVGDTHQCQPTGTMIELRENRNGKSGKLARYDRISQPIETVFDGDVITSYVMRDGREACTAKVLSRSKRKYKGELVCVEAGGCISKYTPDHICMAAFKSEYGYAVYLMAKNDKFRVGVAKIKYSGNQGSGLFGPSKRLNDQRGDHLWILDILENRKSAMALESKVSATYGIPELMFASARDSGRSRGCIFSQSDLDAIWRDIDNRDRAISCLRQFGRVYDLPLISRGESPIYVRSTQRVFACNLIDGFFEFKLLAGGNAVGKIWREDYDGWVHSLKVSDDEIYFADGILTHNCIYAFRGSLSNSMQTIRETFGSQSLPLSICYRCPKLVVAEAKKIVPHIEPHEDQIEGEVRSIDKYGPSTFGRKDIILCRNMMPLVSLSHALMEAKVPCKVMGRDFAHNLLTLIDKMKAGEDVDLLEKRLGEFKAKELAKLSEDPDLNGSRIQALEDKISTLMSFVTNCPEGPSRTVTYIKADITKTFRLNDKGNSDILCLSTGHKAKGGEWNTVYFLDRHRIPSKYAKTKEALQQEYNLEYVMLTRAKKRLFFIDMDGYDPSFGNAHQDEEVFDIESF